VFGFLAVQKPKKKKKKRNAISAAGGMLPEKKRKRGAILGEPPPPDCRPSLFQVPKCRREKKGTPPIMPRHEGARAGRPEKKREKKPLPRPFPGYFLPMVPGWKGEKKTIRSRPPSPLRGAKKNRSASSLSRRKREKRGKKERKEPRTRGPLRPPPRGERLKSHHDGDVVNVSSSTLKSAEKRKKREVRPGTWWLHEKRGGKESRGRSTTSPDATRLWAEGKTLEGGLGGKKKSKSSARPVEGSMALTAE